jgi:hypothetical protein
VSKAPIHNQITIIGCESQEVLPGLSPGGAFSLPGAGGPAGGAGGGAPYKDEVAQVVTGKTDAKKGCGGYAQVSSCSTGKHHFGKKLFCNQQWCLICGKMDSAAHKRRMARKVPKVRQLKAVGNLVIEWPVSYRPGLRTKKAWRDAVDVAAEVLFGKHTRRGREGGYFERGLEDWHWFNDERPGYRADVFNPHMNFILDYPGALEPEELASLKDDLREALGCRDLIVHYGFATTPGQIMHLVRYNTRATFLNREWDDRLAAELYDFRQSRSWGKWNDEPVWELAQAEAEGENIGGLDAVSKLQEHVCPDCGAPLAVMGYKAKLNHKSGEREVILDKTTGLPVPVYWSKPIPSILLEASGAVQIGGTGYYRIPAGWFEPEPEREKIPLALTREINAVRVKGLRQETVKRRRAENWKRYVSENRSRYLMSGGDDGG